MSETAQYNDHRQRVSESAAIAKLLIYYAKITMCTVQSFVVA